MKSLLRLGFILIISAGLSAQSLLVTPECVNYDSLNNRYLVSCYSNGTVVQIDTDGNEQIYRTGLGKAYSNHISNDTFYVSNGQRVYGINLNDSSETYWTLIISGSHQLDGLTTDSSGNLYICDFDYSNTAPDAIYKIDVDAQTYSVFVDENDGLSVAPQDVIFDAENNRLIMVGYSNNAPIQAISLPDGTVSNLVTTATTGMDGIAYDNFGNYYIAAWEAGEVWKYTDAFTNPPELVSSNHASCSNIGYNRLDDILAITDYEDNNIEFVNTKVGFVSDTLWGEAPLETNFSGFSYIYDDISSWNWDFGDGGTGTELTPNHTYNTPGMYDVSLTISVDDTTFVNTKSDYIFVLADSLISIDVQGDPGTTVEAVIYGRNTIPLNYIKIPVEYSGILNISLDSFSTAGCRTEALTLSQIHFEPMQWRTCFSLRNSSSNSLLDLEPGAGPILKLYFSISPSAVIGRTSSIILDGYSTRLPEMRGLSIRYTPNLVEGLVSLPGICGDANSDTLVNIIDVTYLIAFLYAGGAAPTPIEAADLNGDGNVNILDITYLIAYLYQGGPEPAC